MRAARYSLYGDLRDRDASRQRPPRDLHGRNMGPKTVTQPELLAEGTWGQAARQKVTSYTTPLTPPPPTERLKHAFENITLPQTSFAGSNNVAMSFQENVPAVICDILNRSY